MAGDDVTITITANNGQAIRAFRDVNGQLRDMSGRFVSEGSVMTNAMNRVAAGIGGVRGSIIPLASAAVPLAAALAPIAAKAAGAGVAVAAFGAAVAGQVSNLTEAADAQDKYTDAVVKYGQGSKQAADAQRTVAATLAGMPQSTARAAIALGTLKDGFKSWSDEMADFTMTPVEKSFTVLGQLVPKLTDTAKGASAQLDRLVTVAGGAVASPGFDALADRMSTFANSALGDAVDGMIHFARVVSEGDASGPIKAFMDYAEHNGPALRDTLSSVGDALTTLVEAAADAGPGMLMLVTAAADLVAALPPELVTTLMQVAVGLKAVSLAGAAAGAVAGRVTRVRDAIMGLAAVSTAAGGGLTGLRAAFASLSMGTKLGLVGAAIGGLALGVNELAKSARGAPPDVDKLVTSLKGLSTTGQFTGELKKTFGDMDGFVAKIRQMDQAAKEVDAAKPFLDLAPGGAIVEKVAGKVDDLVNGTKSLAATKEDFKAFDEAFAALASGGNTQVAAKEFEKFEAVLKSSGKSTREIKELFPEYTSALADAKFEQELAAESMGVFGQAAQDTSAKLEAQKGAADGLRASILALNDVNRSAHDAQTQFGEAVDNLTASFKEHGATLSADTEAGRANRDAMSAAAAAQDELIASGLAAGESLGSMTKRSEELRETMMRLAVDAFGGNKTKAQEYVNTLLGVPGEIKTLVKLEREEAISGLKAVQAEIDATPGAKSIKVDTLNGAAIKALEAVGLKTKQLPDGKTQVFTATGKSLGDIGSVRKALDNLNGKTANTYTNHNITYHYRSDGASFLGASGRYAAGGKVRGYADGGDVQAYPMGGYVQGPGSGTSDSIITLLASGNVVRTSDTEFIVNARQTKKHRRLLELINSDRLPRFARGGSVTKSEREARNAARGDLTLSHFGVKAGYKDSEIIGQLARADTLGSLVTSLNQWRSTIMKGTHGGQERGLLRALDSSGRKLLSWEKQLTKVSASLEKARDKLDSLKSAAASLTDSVKSGILSGANITRAAGAENSRVTINTILSQMQGSASNASEFDRALKTLKTRGLSGALLQQVAEAGIEGGGLETAQALLGASSGQLKSLNSLQSRITGAAGSAGKTAADAVFGAQIKAQQAYVTTLTRSQDRLQKSMVSLAKSIERMIERAFGKAAGGIVGGAASGGVRSARTWVGEHGPELLDLPAGSRVWSNPDSRRMQAQAWASMLNEPQRPSGRPAVMAGTAGGDRPIVLNVHLGEKEFGQIWVDVGRKQVATRGGVKATLGRLE